MSQHNSRFRSKTSFVAIVYTDVETESILQAVYGEQVVGLRGDGTRPDVLEERETDRTHILITNTSSNSQKKSDIRKRFKHEAEKKRQYS